MNTLCFMGVICAIGLFMALALLTGLMIDSIKQLIKPGPHTKKLEEFMLLCFGIGTMAVVVLLVLTIERI